MKNTRALFSIRFAQFTFLTLALWSGRAFASGDTLQVVACPDRDVARIDLYDQNAHATGIKLEAYTPITLFQGWGHNTVTKGSGERALKFVRIQVPGESSLIDQTLFIYEDSVLSRKKCEALRRDGGPAADAAHTPKDNAGDEDDDAAKVAAPKSESVATNDGLQTLTSSACCGFPLKSVTRSFMAGIAKFGAGRRIKRGGKVVGHRTHGGSDLYGDRGDSVLAVADGEVIREPYMFKRPALALDVRHAGGFVVRYGEITGRSFKLSVGSHVKQGQTIGEMGYVPGAPSPMIHFELYRGTETGDLTTDGNKYLRRGDLLDPTSYLRRWGHI